MITKANNNEQTFQPVLTTPSVWAYLKISKLAVPNFIRMTRFTFTCHKNSNAAFYAMQLEVVKSQKETGWGILSMMERLFLTMESFTDGCTQTLRQKWHILKQKPQKGYQGDSNFQTVCTMIAWLILTLQRRFLHQPSSFPHIARVGARSQFSKKVLNLSDYEKKLGR